MSDNQREHERIRSVYAGRDHVALGGRYAWWQPDVIVNELSRRRALADLLLHHVGADLSEVEALDVGCGSGGFIRQLVEWGSDPLRLTGIDLLEDRVAAAQQKSAPGISWRVGGMEALEAQSSYDLISAFTVFSSILDPAIRASLATDMWARLRPGGTLLIFDFRVNNPSNADVRRVKKTELQSWWPEASGSHYRSTLLAPPLARRLAPLSVLLTLGLEKLLPPLRTHFFYVAKKAGESV